MAKGGGDVTIDGDADDVHNVNIVHTAILSYFQAPQGRKSSSAI
jgi:hypothetical protein